MNLLLLRADEMPQNDASSEGILRGSRAKEVILEHGLVDGISITAGIINGQIGHATISAIIDDTVRFTFTPERLSPPKLPITLAVAYSRPQASKRVIQLAAQSGVRELHFFPTATSQKSYQQSTVFQQEELQRQIELGLQQGCDTVPPTVSLWTKFYEFEKWLQQPDSPTRRFIADTGYAGSPTSAITSTEEVLFIVGAEQGFTPAELEIFRGQNCASVSLGPRILKVDVACAFLLGAHLARTIL